MRGGECGDVRGGVKGMWYSDLRGGGMLDRR